MIMAFPSGSREREFLTSRLKRAELDFPAVDGLSPRIEPIRQAHPQEHGNRWTVGAYPAASPIRELRRASPAIDCGPRSILRRLRAGARSVFEVHKAYSERLLAAAGIRCLIHAG